MTRVAVVGCGRWGRNLVRCFYDLGALSCICDVDRNSREFAEKSFPGIQVVSDLKQLLETDKCESIVIASPAEQHVSMVEAALLAGKDVFVEKPLALRLSDGERLVRLADRMDKILMVGHLLEYHPAISKLRELIDSGELGRIQYVYSNRLNLGRVRREENILWSFAPHDIAVILRLIGDMPIEITATGGAYLQPNIADITVTSLLFDNGVRAHIFVSWLHPYKEQKLVIIGSKKMACFNDVSKNDKLLLFDQGIDWVNGEPTARMGLGTKVEFDLREPLRIECEHFLDCLQTRQQPLTNGVSALRVLQVLQAAQRSLQTHGEPVQFATSQFEVVSL